MPGSLSRIMWRQCKMWCKKSCSHLHLHTWVHWWPIQPMLQTIKWVKVYNWFDTILNLIIFAATPRPIEVIQPCNPSPCGTNAQCSEQRGAASCRCILDYIGDPYVECRPECTVNSECPRDKACVNNHCTDPCPGVCGVHASCRVANHVPQCTCDPGYSGNAFIACTRVTTCKFFIIKSSS